MRLSALFVLLLAVLMFLIPVATLKNSGSTLPTLLPSSQSGSSRSASSGNDREAELSSAEELPVENPGPEGRPASLDPQQAPEELPLVTSFQILNQSTGKVQTVTVQEYVRGAVAAEMPATFHSEAMKAQAVAAHTYALRQHLLQQQNPDPALKGADFAADPDNLKGYATEKEMRKRFGDLADEYWNKIADAADSVLGYVMVYEGEPILAAYHSTCVGITEDASNVWSGSAPYLVPVESPGDLLSPSLESTVSYTSAQLGQLLKSSFEGLELPDDPAQWFHVLDRSPSGYVVLLDVGNLTLHGKDLRSALELRSTNFKINYQNDTFTFQVMGYGHGVGMSQYGADYMARQGSTFDEILTHYYTGAQLVLQE